jgi:anti-sigma B factor antagonist
LGVNRSSLHYTLRTNPAGLIGGTLTENTMSDSRLRVTEESGITQVEFIDRNILDEVNIQAISEEVSGLIDAASTPRILINFTNVDHLSSAALGALITINKKIREKSGQLRLANIDPQIYEIFVITQLNSLFNIHDTADEAIEQFAS